MAHINYPPTLLSGELLRLADLREMQEVVRGIRVFLDRELPGSFQTLLSNLPNLTSTNPGPLRTSIRAYNSTYAGQEIQHGSGGGGGGETGGGNGEPSPLMKEFGQYDVSQVDRQIVTSGLFSNGSGTLTAFHTASLLGDTSASYVEVYNEESTNSTAQVQFAVGYAHINGSGSIGNTTKTTSGNRETAALYRQFRNVILAPNTNKFTFTGAPAESSSGYDDFYFIVFNRAQMREKVDPGNWELRISGSTRTVRLIDDSGATSNPTISQAGRVYNIVSGSIAGGTSDIKTAASLETSNGAPGLFYPDLGILVMNRDWLVTNAGGTGNILPTFSANTNDNQASKFYNAVSGGLYVAARREEEISSVSYFCRALNTEFNYSSNPTYASSSGDTTGLYTVPSFKSNPRSYITSVGLYAEDGDLVAVAKLSQPQLKSFSREAVVKVKLDY